MDKSQAEINLWKDPILAPHKKHIEYSVELYSYQKQYIMAQLGVTREDLLQGVMLRLSRIRERKEQGEYDKNLGSVKTWVDRQVVFAMGDVLREYSWSKPILVRKQQERCKKNKAYIPFHITDMGEIIQENESYPCIQENTAHVNHLIRLISNKVCAYSQRSQDIFFQYYMRGLSMQAIADKYQLSESRISQLLKRMRKEIVQHVRYRTESQIKTLAV